MAVFDTSKIEGFDGMTAEQKLDAVLKFNLPDAPDMSLYVSKETFDKKASETASLSKQLKEKDEQLRAKMTEDEQKKADADKELADMKTEIETLRKSKTISDYTAKYVALGYDAELAASTAKAMADGDMETVFKNGEAHKTALEKKIKEDLMNKTPKPDGAGGGKQPEDSDIAKAKELAKAKSGNSKSYDEIMSKYK